jgi:hypothetical protein
MSSILLMNSFAQTVTIVPTGTPAKPNLIPVNNDVSFSINPIGFGSCMNNLSYAWAVLNSKGDTVLKSTSSSPKYNFVKEDTYTVSLTVKTLPGGYCGSNVTRTAYSTLKIGKEGPGGVPKPTLFSANALGTTISAYTMDNTGQITSGPYDYFDPFPADNAITAALSMDDKGNFFYLPTFMNGPNPLAASTVAMHGVVEVWAVDKNANNAPVVVARFDMNGSSTAELGLYRMGLDQKGNAWILAGDGTNMYATTFKTNGTKPLNLSDVTTFQVPFESGSAADFQSGDLAFDNKGNMYVLAGSSSGVNIYTMPTSGPGGKLSKKWKVTNTSGQNFGLAVTGTVFDSNGDMYFSALDGIYFIDYSAVNAVTATAVVQKVSDNFGLMDLATSQFPAAWTPPLVVLPVRLIQFSGALNGEKVYLNWRVAANETGNYFELEKSYNGTSFKTQTLIFNTDKQGEETYSFVDASSSSENVYYRLKTVNKDGSITYSNIVFFRAQAKQSASLTLVQNPVQSAVNFNYIASQNVAADIAVYTSNGVRILSQKHSLQKGNNSLTISLNNMLKKGIYLLEVNDGFNRQTVRFVKQ